jgi:hypothetical protein
VRSQQDSAGHQGRFRGTHHKAPAHGLSSCWRWCGVRACVCVGGGRQAVGASGSCRCRQNHGSGKHLYYDFNDVACRVHGQSHAALRGLRHLLHGT